MSSSEIEAHRTSGELAKHGADGEKQLNPFARIILFIKQVFAELKKVVTPTRKELWNYFLVVLAFVIIMMVFVSLIDLGFGTLAGWVFGTPN
ncbi:preprotein translocase subunit SecE [Leucobacter sp. OH1287]|uniref:preprotein translocase subunit SecE n=1 Tax=Leucobacter sp. OH1287 TaxID=2491049 RepID=UPI0035120ED6